MNHGSSDETNYRGWRKVTFNADYRKILRYQVPPWFFFQFLTLMEKKFHAVYNILVWYINIYNIVTLQRCTNVHFWQQEIDLRPNLKTVWLRNIDRRIFRDRQLEQQQLFQFSNYDVRFESFNGETFVFVFSNFSIIARRHRSAGTVKIIVDRCNVHDDTALYPARLFMESHCRRWRR